MTLRVSQSGARRFLLEALDLHLMVARKPVSQHIQRLEAVQIDPVARVSRNQDLVLSARYAHYQPSDLIDALKKHNVFEYRANEASILPIGDYPLLEGTRQRMRTRLDGELGKFASVVEEIVNRLRTEGPLPSRAFDSTEKVKGYWDTSLASTKTTSHVLNLMLDTARIMVVERVGTMRYFDLPERVVPSHLWEASLSCAPLKADAALFDKYIRAYKLVRGGHERLGWGTHPMAWRQAELHRRVQQGTITPVSIENVDSPYYVATVDIERLQYWNESSRLWPKHRIWFLPPLDNLLWDRKRLEHLFDFYYRWEVYVPAAKRTFGVYGMPILAGDQLVGRIDPEVRRKDSQLVIHNIAWEEGFRPSPTFLAHFESALASFSERLGMKDIEWHGPKNGYA